MAKISMFRPEPKGPAPIIQAKDIDKYKRTVCDRCDSPYGVEYEGVIGAEVCPGCSGRFGALLALELGSAKSLLLGGSPVLPKSPPEILRRLVAEDDFEWVHGKPEFKEDGDED